MRYLLTTACMGVAALLSVGTASANDELIKLQQDTKHWVMPTGNYANTRFSKLDQITATTSATAGRRGPSRPACCAGMRAHRSSSAT